jgi:hypothetical protein
MGAAQKARRVALSVPVSMCHMDTVFRSLRRRERGSSPHRAEGAMGDMIRLDICCSRLYNVAGNKPTAGVGSETLKSQDVDGGDGLTALHAVVWMNA